MDYSAVDLTGIKGVFFDFGGVICESVTSQSAIFELWGSLGLTRAQWDKGFADYRHLWDSGRMTATGMYRRMLADNGIADPSDELLEKLWRTDASAFVRTVIPETLAFMKALKASGRKVGILTNMSNEFAHDYFPTVCQEHVALADVVVISAHVKLYKPQREIYDLAVEKIALKPEELLFVDDLPANVEGARRAGWRAVQFVSG